MQPDTVVQNNLFTTTHLTHIQLLADPDSIHKAGTPARINTRIGVATRYTQEKENTYAIEHVLKVLCSYLVTAICKFALLMYMSKLCCYVLLNF